MSILDMELSRTLGASRTQLVVKEIHDHIRWAPLERILLAEYPVGKSPVGNVAYPPLVLLKAVLLQKWFGVRSDPELENQINDRVSFKVFIGLPLGDLSPDHSVISRLRGQVGSRVMERVHAGILGQLQEKGFPIDAGLAVDARLVRSVSTPVSRDKLEANKLERTVGTHGRVMDKAERCVFKGEHVPASEKVVSFFEEHTDIIVKGGRDTEYGHKVFLSGGSSTMILDCLIVSGNPADTDRYRKMLDRHTENYGRMPSQVSADGGFASQENLAYVKGKRVKDEVFTRKRGLSVLVMAKSTWVYKKLRNFCAGIEAGISELKRAFGLDRCLWTGWEGIKQYVWSSIVSYNLLVLARSRMARA